MDTQNSTLNAKASPLISADLYRTVSITLPIVAFAFLIAIVSDVRSGQENPFDRVAHPLMFTALLALETVLLLMPRSYPYVTGAMLLGSSVFFLSKLVALLFFPSPGLNVLAEFTESFFWIPGIYLLAFFTTRLDRARLTGRLFVLLLVAISAGYGIIKSPDSDPSVLNALVQLNLANCTLFVLSGIVYRFANQHVRTVAHAQNLEHLVYVDALTGLPNRRQLERTLEEATHISNTTGFSLLSIDLDGFKSINDTLGHEGGDLVLREVASRLRDACRARDVVVRVSGDEFAAVLLDSREPEARLVAMRFLESLEQPLIIAGHPVQISASVGVSMFPEDGMDAPTLLRHADRAMYHVKQNGKQAVHFFASTGVASGSHND
ncbi:GGDEF domain-containing protein [Deinococcus deserti]|uniref:Putative diguanylate-cyclase putative membrane protein n=1 Tax=Deinococcus deserti (strain DSM 17065 / CIP 109153 / LMG 22923 / VCD115) TaxID=546414 RepID=C1D3A0_DEIDV|nr:putative diguanylate-cyclase; putative membrane protein [Deinococcus deserti VCD115]